MAITRLKDIVTVFQDKWTYGDSRFGYESEINETHNTVYPAMIIQPPESIMPDIYSGREEFEFEVNFYNLYQQAAQSAVTLQHRWDNLQDLATEWMDLVLKNFQDATVQVYLNDESIEFERVKEVANDRLVQIKLVFTMSAFTKCFRPVSNYPSDINDLVVWLRADSGVTFDIATQQVSAWTDYSGNSNSVAQATSASQPLRIGYDGANDKARINFNGTSHILTSNNNAPITANDYTILSVFKYTDLSNISQRVFSIRETTDRVLFGLDSTGRIFFKSIDDEGNQGQVLSDTSELMSDFNIAMAQCKKVTGGSDLTVQFNNNASVTTNVANFNNNNTGFDDAVFVIGGASNLTSTTYLKGDLCELIVFNRALNTTELAIVKDYLNNKYRIY
tara:strand:+ start:3739 stop:4911 length:1173 start_codon:yes stop_codon:yes gene_type:complete